MAGVSEHKVGDLELLWEGSFLEGTEQNGLSLGEVVHSLAPGLLEGSYYLPLWRVAAAFFIWWSELPISSFFFFSHSGAKKPRLLEQLWHSLLRLARSKADLSKPTNVSAVHIPCRGRAKTGATCRFSCTRRICLNWDFCADLYHRKLRTEPVKAARIPLHQQLLEQMRTVL